MDGTAYSELEARFDRIGRLEESTAVLRWDQATVMPAGGAAARAGQLATLDGLVHELLTHPTVAEQLDEAGRSSGSLDPWQGANLREMRHRWRHAAALAGDLVEALARARSACEMTWREARANDDFAALAPGLEELLSLVREEARCKAEALGLSPYDALLDGYDAGLREARFRPLFEDLASFLPGFLAEVLERQGPAPPPLEGPFPAERQQEAARRFMAALGFDFEHGRLDVSHHPFTGGVPDDVRITSRWDESDFLSGWMAVLHETGHALYQRALPEKWRRQPVGDARGMTLHESQSLLLEMQVCRSPEFLEFAAPILRDVFAGAGETWTAESLGRLQRRVAPGLIRVDADEVTYPLHVILRTRLERSMIRGELLPADLPGAWSEGMRDLLGLTPTSDREGCLQDVHWPSGAFGYFPTYTLGALAAAQLFAAARDALPGLPAALSRGEFGPLFRWLRDHVHSLGCRHETDEILEKATGQPLGIEAFKSHLSFRYLGT